MKITNFKRFLLIALVAIMVFSLFSCTDGTTEDGETTTEEVVNNEETSGTPDGSTVETGDKVETNDNGETTEGETTEGETTEGETTEGETTEGETTEGETTEETEPACQHAELETLAAKAATCEETGLTEGKKCTACGTVTVAQETVPALGHSFKGYTYVANPDGDEALLQGTCENCQQTTTKPASFFVAIETIYGDCSDENVVLFQADATVAPLMGSEMFNYLPGHPNYPENGYAPIRSTFPVYGGMFGISGWIGYANSAVTDGAAFKVVDLEGNVLIGWTEMAAILGPNAGDANVDAELGKIYTDGTATGIRFSHIININNYIKALENKTVKFIFAFNTAAGVEGATYIPYATLQVNVSACAHVNATAVDAKAATCTEAGNAAYKACAACGKFVLADGTLADEAPVIAALGHDEVVDDAVAATCTTEGKTEGKHCSVCNEVFVAQEPIAALGHTQVDKAWTASTEKEEGWEAHKACANCDMVWDTEGNEIEAVPTIAKIVPTVNKYLGFEYFKGVNVGGATPAIPANWKPQAPSADRTFVRYERAGRSIDGNINFIASNSAVTGQYLIIKYRTDHMTTLQIWANTKENGHSGGKANFYKNGFIADEKWHIAIVNLAEGIPSYVLPAEDNTYTIKWARLDVLDGEKSAGYFDVGFVALCDDVTKIISIMSEEDMEICPHVSGEWTFNANNPAYEQAVCTICGDVAERTVSTTPQGLLIFTPDAMDNKLSGWKSGTVEVKDDNGMPYVQFTAGAAITSEQNGALYCNANNPITNIGKYVAILCRTSADSVFEVVADSYNPGVKTGVLWLGNPGTEWTLIVKEYKPYGDGTSAETKAAGYYDGEALATFRLDWFNPGTVEAGDTADIAYIAYFDSINDAYAYYGQYLRAYLGVEGHECYCVTTWDEETKLYNKECVICGDITTSDMMHKAEAAYTASDTGAKGYSVEKMDGFVRYTVTGADGTDFYTHIYRGGSAVTGQYVVIKYRLCNNNGSNATARSFFAGTTAGNCTGATGGDVKDNQMNVSSFIGDGEWHYMVVSPKETNKAFVANGDGTYTWAYLRIGFNPSVFDGSCYLDVDELAFADNLTAVEAYIAKNTETAPN